MTPFDNETNADDAPETAPVMLVDTHVHEPDDLLQLAVNTAGRTVYTCRHCRHQIDVTDLIETGPGEELPDDLADDDDDDNRSPFPDTMVHMGERFEWFGITAVSLSFQRWLEAKPSRVFLVVPLIVLVCGLGIWAYTHNP